MTASARSCFFWRGQPSIFADDPAFKPTVSGRTQSQASSKVATANVERITKTTGRNPGTLAGIARKERLQDIRPVGYRGRAVR